MPWSGINQIKVTFNENVTVDQSDLLLTGVNVPSYNVAGSTFSYNSTTFTATWILPLSIGADQLMLALNANGSDPIRDAAGNHLDGEWTNPASTTDTGDNVYPSGNGTAGGNFNFRFNVLPGDANQDGLVNISDLTSLASHWQQTSQGFLSADLNHDGQVNISDLTMLASAWQATLPAGTPTPGDLPGGCSHGDGRRCVGGRNQRGGCTEPGRRGLGNRASAGPKRCSRRFPRIGFGDDLRGR